MKPALLMHQCYHSSSQLGLRTFSEARVLRFYMHNAAFTGMNVEDRRVETIRSLMLNQSDRVGRCEG